MNLSIVLSALLAAMLIFNIYSYVKIPEDEKDTKDKYLVLLIFTLIFNLSLIGLLIWKRDCIFPEAPMVQPPMFFPTTEPSLSEKVLGYTDQVIPPEERSALLARYGPNILEYIAKFKPVKKLVKKLSK